MNDRIAASLLPLSGEDIHAENPSRRRGELGCFLRARRESLDPNRLGLPRTGRRRTPGLRREEVALLADVGVTWYTWLEQGRDIQASPKVLSAIAQALQCNAAEAHHLFALAGLSDPATTVAAPVCEHVSAATAAILRQLNPFPALVQNARYDLVGFNDAYCRLINVDLHQIPEEDRNCAYLAFTNPHWRASIANWETVMPHIVAHFRSAMADHMDDPAWQRTLDRLMASDEFRETWQRYEVVGVSNQIKRFVHPREGELHLHQTNWWSAPRNGDRLVVYMPADAQTESRLRRIAEQGPLALPLHAPGDPRQENDKANGKRSRKKSDQPRAA